MTLRAEDVQIYDDPFFVGEVRDLECQVDERDDTAYTFTSGTFTLYDSTGIVRVGPVANTNASFSMGSPYLRYKLDGTTAPVSADLYAVEWKYVVSGQTYIDRFQLDIRTLP